jgi:hypothetical protein
MPHILSTRPISGAGKGHVAPDRSLAQGLVKDDLVAGRRYDPGSVAVPDQLAVRYCAAG